ncbi:hypothetical protein HPB50_025329 [Hyalomma asiaticum]|uniref:Uncharacterized protein n=1 Tax=Hyalomma asiaticum TaxID=266040 RepID=A0ACB7SQV9_HYAAI|nr:hypothetical protein HPB50_025329 [Hyalomma asiaticum]
MELGSFAVYEGVYKGSDPIMIVSLNSVPDLGKPGSSDVTVKIAIRKNLKMYVFMPDYGPRPVVAPFKELVKKGHYYIPRFSTNFSVRNAQVLAVGTTTTSAFTSQLVRADSIQLVVFASLQPAWHTRNTAKAPMCNQC